MNPNWDEGRMREVLVEEAIREEAGAPDFASVWAAAGARVKAERRRRYVIGVTAVAAALTMLGIIMSGVFPGGRTEQSTRVSSASRAGNLPWQSAVLICEWRSPTDFLLRLPGEHWPEAMDLQGGVPR